MNDNILCVDGDVEQPLQLGFADLCSFPAAEQVLDVSRLHPKRQGDGVLLSAIIDRARPKPTASRVVLHASGDGFSANVSLEAVRDEGIVAYQLHDEPMPASAGGPFRFLLRHATACGTSELDDCSNVKYLDRIEISAE